MKTSFSSGRALIAASAVAFSLGFVGGAQAQPEAPAKPKAGKAKPKADKKATDAKTPKPRTINLMPRMVTATETQLGKPLTPELKDKITEAYRARAAAIAAANEQYYVDFAALTGLTVDQAREIDKPKPVKKPTEPKVETKTNMDQLTTGEANTDPAVTPDDNE